MKSTCITRTLFKHIIATIWAILFLLPSFSLAYSISYSYDNLGRLTQIEYTDTDLRGTISYSYDNSGNILVVDESITCSPGDLNCDGNITLDDTILGMQVLSGLQPTGRIHVSSDINHNQKIDQAEVIYTLQYISK